MTIQAITGSIATPAIAPVSTASPTAPADPAAPTSDSTKLSSYAQLMSKLQSLEQTDPAKAKQVLGDLATKLAGQAQSVGGDAGKRMAALADKLQTAATTGDLSSLQPQHAQAATGASGQQHHGGGHHHHHKAESSYTQQQDQGTSVMDTINSVLSADGV